MFVSATSPLIVLYRYKFVIIRFISLFRRGLAGNSVKRILASVRIRASVWFVRIENSNCTPNIKNYV